MSTLGNFRYAVIQSSVLRLREKRFENDEEGALLYSAQSFEALIMAGLASECGLPTTNSDGDLFNQTLGDWRFYVESSSTVDSDVAREMYVSHTETSDALLTLFPNLTVDLERILRRNTGWASQEGEASGRTSFLAQLMSGVLLLYSQMTSGRDGRDGIELQYGIRFAGEREWRTLLSTMPSPDALVQQAHGQNSASVLRGFLRLIGYLSELNNHFDRVLGDLANPTDAFRIREKLRDIHDWRINLSSRRVSARVDELVNLSVTMLLSDASLTSLISRDELEESFHQSLNVWFGGAVVTR